MTTEQLDWILAQIHEHKRVVIQIDSETDKCEVIRWIQNSSLYHENMKATFENWKNSNWRLGKCCLRLNLNDTTSNYDSFEFYNEFYKHYIFIHPNDFKRIANNNYSIF